MLPVKQAFNRFPQAGTRSLRSYAIPAVLLSIATSGLAATAAAAEANSCSKAVTGITLPPGFCASVFADHIGHARHLVVSSAGVVYANTWSGYYYGGDTGPEGGYLVAMQDTKGTGTADAIERFGDSKAQGSAGGTGIALYDGALYAEVNDRIVRYRLKPGEVVPTGTPEVIVSGMPIDGDHPMHPFIIDAHGALFVDLGSATNACEEKNRIPYSPGNKPCVEKETRAGIWKYDANKSGQTFSAADRYATGIRNGEGMAFDAKGRLFVSQHGRDQLFQNWPRFYKAEDGPRLPAEEVVQLESGHDYGWPECYFDGARKKLMLAPEYGGDGKRVGLCAERTPPAAFFPAHWAPNALLIPRTTALPAAYRDGVYIAFHGSWNRAPAPQDGYNVTFQPMKDGKAAGPYIVFADGFAGAHKEPGRAQFRPSGLAEGPDGALYISDDSHGRIWKVTYQGPMTATLKRAPVPTLEATNSAAAALPVPPGANATEVALGARIFHGEAANGTCAGCHGTDGKGSPTGADLTAGSWLWSDGSLAGIRKTIREGVMAPKQHGGAMPPLGGVSLSDAELNAVSAYVWALGHPNH